MKNKKTNIILIFLFGLSVGVSLTYYWHIRTSAHPHINQSTHPHINQSAHQVYTCAMHPQVRQNEPGLCPICEMDLVLLESNSSSDNPLVLEMTEDAVKLANIQTSIIGRKDGEGEKNIRLSGKIQADERLSSSQVAHVPGRIEKLYVTFTGEPISKGQKLATVYSPELITAQKELLEALKFEKMNPGLIVAARNKLRFWKIDTALITSIENTGKIQEMITIYADESGVVTNRRVTVGDYVKKGSLLFDLMNLSKVWVLFDAYEEDLSSISRGDFIEFTTSSIPERIFKTHITFIDPVIDSKTRVASLRAEVNNPAGLLKPEMFVNGVLKNKAKNKKQLAVPKSAVLWTGRRSVVYVKIPEANIPSYQFREVVLGESLGDHYQIIEGLDMGEEVVTYGSFVIDAAAQLNNQMSMMNQDVAVKKIDDSQKIPNFMKTTPLKFKQQLNSLSNNYLLLKDVFVLADKENISKISHQFLNAFAKIDTNLLKGDAHTYWMEQQQKIQMHSKRISELSTIEQQRQQFYFLSQSLIKTIKAFGTADDTLYVQHCPMANDNKGADWISNKKEIRNPYFGSKMLKCGFIRDTIR